MRQPGQTAGAAGRKGGTLDNPTLEATLRRMLAAQAAGKKQTTDAPSFQCHFTPFSP